MKMTIYNHKEHQVYTQHQNHIPPINNHHNKDHITYQSIHQLTNPHNNHNHPISIN